MGKKKTKTRNNKKGGVVEAEFVNIYTDHDFSLSAGKHMRNQQTTKLLLKWSYESPANQ